MACIQGNYIGLVGVNQGKNNGMGDKMVVGLAHFCLHILTLLAAFFYCFYAYSYIYLSRVLMKNYYTTAEASAKLRVSRDTLLRWFREGKISPVPRDSKGWRTFTEEDLARILGETKVAGISLNSEGPSGHLPQHQHSGIRSHLRIIKHSHHFFTIYGCKVQFVRSIFLHGLTPLLSCYKSL